MNSDKLNQSFNIYFHDNFCDSNDESWKPETYIKSGEFNNLKDVITFIDNYITSRSRIINIHQYRICFFANGFHPALETYKGKLNEDYGEFRIAIKYGMIYNFLKSESSQWNPKVFWQTYENIPEVFKTMIILFSKININEFNLAGLSLIMKQDIVEFRWLMHTFDKDKYEKIKTLISNCMEYLIYYKKCPKTIKCYDFNYNQF